MKGEYTLRAFERNALKQNKQTTNGETCVDEYLRKFIIFRTQLKRQNLIGSAGSLILMMNRISL